MGGWEGRTRSIARAGLYGWVGGWVGGWERTYPFDELLETGVVNPGVPFPFPTKGVFPGEERAAGVGVFGHKLIFALEEVGGWVGGWVDCLVLWLSNEVLDGMGGWVGGWVGGCLSGRGACRRSGRVRP